MSQSDDYLIPETWTWDEESGGTFGSINRPLAGATFEKELPIGKHPLQLYSQGTPNGCLLYTSPSPRDPKTSRMPSSA